ncbi:hypothetical protein BDR04DRAFT_683386 [Suillus decipiens]|nr:hypothetical protein BDR04DRAFT_683386 [Suillus decipiens]
MMLEVACSEMRPTDGTFLSVKSMALITEASAPRWRDSREPLSLMRSNVLRQNLRFWEDFYYFTRNGCGIHRYIGKRGALNMRSRSLLSALIVVFVQNCSDCAPGSDNSESVSSARHLRALAYRYLSQ